VAGASVYRLECNASPLPPLVAQVAEPAVSQVANLQTFVLREIFKS